MKLTLTSLFSIQCIKKEIMNVYSVENQTTKNFNTTVIALRPSSSKEDDHIMDRDDYSQFAKRNVSSSKSLLSYGQTSNGNIILVGKQSKGENTPQIQKLKRKYEMIKAILVIINIIIVITLMSFIFTQINYKKSITTLLESYFGFKRFKLYFSQIPIKY